MIEGHVCPRLHPAWGYSGGKPEVSSSVKHTSSGRRQTIPAIMSKGGWKGREGRESLDGENGRGRAVLATPAMEWSEEKVTWSRDLNESGRERYGPPGRGFQAEGTACVKALGWDCAWATEGP